MAFQEKIILDLTAAQKAGDAERVGVLRLLLAELKNKEIEKRGKGSRDALSDNEVVDILRREIKKRHEAAVLFRAGKRDDLALQEERDSAIIQTYAPPLMNREDIERTVREFASRGEKDFLTLMRESMKVLKGKADGQMVKEVIESVLRAP